MKNRIVEVTCHSEALIINLSKDTFVCLDSGAYDKVIRLFDLTLDDCCVLVEGVAKYKVNLLDTMRPQESAERPVKEEENATPTRIAENAFLDSEVHKEIASEQRGTPESVERHWQSLPAWKVDQLRGVK